MAFFIYNIKYSFLGLLVLSFIIARIPFIGKYFKVVNTLIHESGHSLMTLFTNGQVIKVELFADTSGTTITKSKSKFGQFMIAFAGYPFASLMGYLFVFLIFNGYFSAILITIGIIAIVNLIFFVRNAHGIFWTLSFTALIFLNFRYGSLVTTVIFATVVCAITLFESIWSSLVITIMSIRKSKSAGDATNLSKLTHIPALVWALFFLALASFVAYKAFLLYLSFDFSALQTKLTL